LSDRGFNPEAQCFKPIDSLSSSLSNLSLSPGGLSPSSPSSDFHHLLEHSEIRSLYMAFPDTNVLQTSFLIPFQELLRINSLVVWVVCCTNMISQNSARQKLQGACLFVNGMIDPIMTSDVLCNIKSWLMMENKKDEVEKYCCCLFNET
jgi:hypothetical protein